MDDLIDQIYEAALVPDRWSDVIDNIVRTASADTGAILVLSQTTRPRAMASERMVSRMEQFVNSTDWLISPRVGKAMQLADGDFEPIEDHMTEQELAIDPVAHGFAELGLGFQLCLSLNMPSDEVVAFTVERELQKGPSSCGDIAILNSLRPHLARSGLMAARLGLERAQSMVAVLEKVGLPGAVLSRTGRVVGSNALFDALASSIIALAGGGVGLVNPAANALLQKTIGQLASGDVALGRSIPVPATDDNSAMVVHAVPLRRTARDIFSGAELLIVVSTLDHAKAPTTALLRGLFDLTPAESRLAQALVSGRHLPELSVDLQVRMPTLRTQLSSVFDKTGTHRQSDLVRLLSAIRLVDTD